MKPMDPHTFAVLQRAVADALDDAPYKWRKAAMQAMNDARADVRQQVADAEVIPLVGWIR